MELVRPAASFEGLIILAVIYFVLNLISGGAKKKGRSTVPPPPGPDEPTPTQSEALSLENILREIEEVKREKAAGRSLPPAGRSAPPPMRPKPAATARTPVPVRRPGPPARRPSIAGDPRKGPLGRSARVRLEDAEDVEERTSLERGSLEVPESLEVLDETRLRQERRLEDFDDEAEAIIQRRKKEAEARNRAHRAVDHVAFHDRFLAGEIGGPEGAAEQAGPRSRRMQLRDAIVWREILGPPRSTEL
jgi:hypothetical protein